MVLICGSDFVELVTFLEAPRVSQGFDLYWEISQETCNGLTEVGCSFSPEDKSYRLWQQCFSPVMRLLSSWICWFDGNILTFIG